MDPDLEEKVRSCAEFLIASMPDALACADEIRTLIPQSGFMLVVGDVPSQASDCMLEIIRKFSFEFRDALIVLLTNAVSFWSESAEFTGKLVPCGLFSDSQKRALIRRADVVIGVDDTTRQLAFSCGVPYVHVPELAQVGKWNLASPDIKSIERRSTEELRSFGLYAKNVVALTDKLVRSSERRGCQCLSTAMMLDVAHALKAEDLGLIEVSVMDSNSRSSLLSCKNMSGKSIVVKSFHGRLENCANDWASLLFVASIPQLCGLVPSVLAGNMLEQYLVLEDISYFNERDDIWDLHLEHDVYSSVRKFALVLAEVATVTRGREFAFQAIRSMFPFPLPDLADEAHAWQSSSEKFLGWLTASGVWFEDAGMARCMNGIASLYESPGTFLGFTHGDLGPRKNCFIRDGQVRFFDFEFAAYRHVLLDAAAWYILSRLPGELCDVFKTSYLTRVAECLSVEETVLNEHWEKICAYEFISMMSFVPIDILAEDREWAHGWTYRHGIMTAICRLKSQFTGNSELSSFRQSVSRLASALNTRWGSVRPISKF